MAKRPSRPNRPRKPNRLGRPNRPPENQRPHAARQFSRPRVGRWVIGLHSAREVIKVRPRAISEAWLRQGWESSQDLRELADALSIEPKAVSPGHLDQLGSGHQGVAFCVNESPVFDWSLLEKPKDSLVLILDNIQDPHNFGAILRSAWLFGVSAVFIPEMRSAPLTPTALKVASGAAEHVPIMVEQNLQDIIKRLKDLNYWVFGLDTQGPGTIWQQRFTERVALVIGSEGSGIRVPIQRLCDELTRIPQVDKSASLNASVAAAVAMAEVVRQQSQLSGMP